MGWRQTSVVTNLVVIKGAGGGEFLYDASNNLRIAQVGATSKDPIQGITCQAGISTFNAFGAVLFLQSIANDATFFYNDTGSSTQGTRIQSIASASGTDPVIATAYPAGVQGIDPAFADFITLVGANIDLGLLVYTRNAKISVTAGSGATRPSMNLNAPEQTTAQHLQMIMAGASPDGTKVGQLLIGQASGSGSLTPTSLAMVEVQGQAAGNPDAAVKVVPGGSNNAYAIAAAADANNRWLADLNGKLRWGNGTAFGDVTLERAAAGILLLTSILEAAEIAAPAAAANPQLFASNASGMLRFVSDTTKGDSQAYNTGHAILVNSANFNVPLTTPATITGLSQTVAAITYKIRAELLISIGGTATALVFQLSGPAVGALTNIKWRLSYEAGTGESVFAGHSIGNFNSAQLPAGTTLPAAAVAHLWMSGYVTFTAAGTLALQIAQTVSSATTNVSLGGEFELFPVG